MGQRIGTDTSSRESGTIVSVRSPVGTGVPNVEQRIIISGINFPQPRYSINNQVQDKHLGENRR